MKKLVVVAMLATSMLTFSCNSKDDKGKDKDKDETVSNDDKIDEEDNSSSDIKKAAAGYCDCFNESLGDMDPKMKRIIVKAGESDNPVQTLQSEMMKLGDQEEQQRLSEEMQKMNSAEMEACGKRISKKYNIDENDKAMQKKMMKQLADNGDCEVLSALMKIGLSQMDNGASDEETPRRRKTTTSDEE